MMAMPISLMSMPMQIDPAILEEQRRRREEEKQRREEEQRRRRAEKSRSRSSRERSYPRSERSQRRSERSLQRSDPDTPPLGPAGFRRPTSRNKNRSSDIGSNTGKPLPNRRDSNHSAAWLKATRPRPPSQRTVLPDPKSLDKNHDFHHSLAEQEKAKTPRIEMNAFAMATKSPARLWRYTDNRLKRLARGEPVPPIIFPELDLRGCCVTSCFAAIYPCAIMNHRNKIAKRYGFSVSSEDWVQACCSCDDALAYNEICVKANEATKEHEELKNKQGYQANAPMSTIIPEELANRSLQEEQTTAEGPPRSPDQGAPGARLSATSQRSSPARDHKEQGVFEMQSIKKEGSMPLSSTSGNASPTPGGASPRAKGKGTAKSHHPGVHQLSSDNELAVSVSSLDLHSLRDDSVVGTKTPPDPTYQPHRLHSDKVVTVHHASTGLHALHLEPVSPVLGLPTEERKSGGQPFLHMPRAPQPLAPMIHRLSNDKEMGHAPGAYPPSSPPPPPSPALHAVDACGLSPDAPDFAGQQQEGKQNHLLSDDGTVIVGPPAAGRRYSGGLVTPPQSGASVSHASPGHSLERDDESIQPHLVEHRVELHRLSDDMFTPGRP